MKKLKKCPFCGGEAYINTETYYRYSIGVKHKEGCYMKEVIEYSELLFETKEEATERWNRRAKRSEE